jgi:hypothetical protein
MSPHKKQENLDLGPAIVELRDEKKIRWDGIGKTLDISPERARNIYRALKGRMNRNPGETKEKLEVKEISVNEKQVTYQGPQIKTIEQLVIAAEVDLDVWEVVRPKINKWDGYRANKEKDIVFEKGIATGYTKDYGGLYIAPLFQVQFSLERKVRLPFEPFISKVYVQSKSRSVPHKGTGMLDMALVIPDTHFAFKRSRSGKLEPLHDRLAISVVLQVAESFSFSKIILLGDNFDFPDLTRKFPVSPEFYQETQLALNEFGWFLGELRSANPDAEIDDIEGNHDRRLVSLIVNQVSQIYQVHQRGVSRSAWEIPNLLSFDELGINWADDYPNGKVWINKGLRCIHGEGLSASKVVSKSDVSTIFGHIHRLEQDSRTVYGREGSRTITAMCPGFLGRVDGIIPGTKSDQNWTQGFAVVYYNNEESSIVHVPIRDGVAIFDRSLWVGKDYSSDMVFKE